MTQPHEGAPDWRSGPTRNSRPTGKLLLRATWQLLRQDRDLLWLPVVGGVASLVALLMLLLPGLLFGSLGGNTSLGGIIGGLVGVFAAASVGIYFQAALVLGAFQRADGYDPSFSSTLKQAWTVRRQVVEWALLTTSVGMVIRVVEQRLGILGAIVGFLGGLAWAIASFFTIPVLVAEGLGPVAATRRSASLVKQRWGVNARSTLRLGLIGALPVLGCSWLIIVGVFAAVSGAVAIGVALIAIGVLAMLAWSVIIEAVFVYTRAMLYRFAVGLPVPGIPAEFYAGAFVPKRRRWFR
jgi:Family of unknown function (DUF6159)